MIEKKSFKFLLAPLFVILFFPIKTVAQEGNSDGLGFSVSPIFNSNQIDPNSSLFYVKTKPNVEQTIQVKVRSTQKETVKVKVNLMDAYTSENSAINYDTPNKIPNIDETLKNPVSQMIEPEVKAFTIGNFEEKKINFSIKPPKEKYEGVKLGAIEFVLDKANDKASMKMDAGYQVGIILANDGKQFNNGSHIEMHEVEPQIVNGSRTVTANLQNPDPFTIENLQINAEITEKKTGKKIKEKEVTGASLAPNSNYNFVIDWGLSQLPKGEFHYHMIIKNDFYNWKFDKDFMITEQQANSINDKSDYKIITPQWIKIIGLLQLVVIIIIFTVLVLRRKKLEKVFKQRKKNRKKHSRKGA